MSMGGVICSKEMLYDTLLSRADEVAGGGWVAGGAGRTKKKLWWQK